ncbi:MAG: glycosyltransferase [Actinomycetota bacterium]|nr:glycosyltransferase [Actinomycetota bacterium]
MTLRRAVVVVPAHDEALNLPGCLESVLAAAGCVPVPVCVVVVLDSCTDGSALVKDSFGDPVHFVEVNLHNVGAARAAGFAYAKALLHAHESDHEVWYANTDADSRVDPDWLARQFRSGAEAVVGVVRVVHWRNTPRAAIRRYLAAYRAKYRSDGHGHHHVHGANMGFRADVYWRAGGFASLANDEDVDLIRRFDAAGVRVNRDRRISVATSARTVGRAPRGFAAHLRSVANGIGRESA